ncbi:helix-turn-helix transcriptional regulator [Protaetiibacter intestinalis]|uniref:helix-turn-helix transcriptional regulator n=1 Tax=Protaetiibacter intestinalis TaxID=2419774 RepID=UPI001475188C|nr:LuxR family transcriptional regulator [Protaetiibacter intestinalis]
MTSPAGRAAVQRTDELDQLAAALGAVEAGGQRAVVVSGEAGIGKTRLIAEFVDSLAERADVVVGNCYEAQELAAYLPVRQILRNLPAVVGQERFDAALAPVARTLAGLLPGGTTSGDALSPVRVHEALDLLLENLSAERPLVVVFEDLHWVDPSTIGFLGAVLRYRSTGRRLLVMSYRSDDVGRGHPLRPFLADLDRGRLATRIEPARLAREAIAEIGSAQLGRALHGIELDRITERSDGIPFFVEELLGLSEQQLPANLRELVLARYDRMSDPTRRVLRMIAASVDVDHRLLRGVAAELGLDDAELDASIDEAVAGGILVIRGDTYAFRHALSQEAVAQELLPGERDRVHRAYARTLEAAHDPARAGDLARHWLDAHEPSLAFDAYLLALGDAQATYATETEAAILEQLVELWPSVPDAAERSGVTRALLLVNAATAWTEAGRTSRADTLLDVAETLLTPDDRRGRGELLVRRVSHAINGRRARDAIEYGLEAAACLADVDDLRTLEHRATLHANVVDAAEQLGDVELAAEHRAEALRLASLTGDAGVEGYVRHLINMSAMERGDVDAALEHLGWVRTHTIASPELELRLALNTADTLHRLGLFAEAAELGRDALARADAYGQRGWAALIAANLADDAAALGFLEEAAEMAERSATQGTDSTFVSYSVRQLARLDVLRDDPASARARLWNHRELLDDVAVDQAEERWGQRAITAAIAAAEGEIAQAETALTSLHGELAEIIVSELPAHVLAAAETLDAARRTGTPADAAAAFLAGARTALRAIPHFEAWAVLADAALSPDEVEAWDAAVVALDQPRVHRWVLPHVLRRRAEAHASAGDREAARADAERSLELARGFGASRDVRLARELASRLGGGGGSAAGAAGGLTAREREVLALVAEGLSNRQIGERLYLSPKTVSVHVTAILRKLGASTRTDAAVRGARLLGDA